MFGLFKKKPPVAPVEQPLDPSLIVPRIKNTNFLAVLREKVKDDESMPATEPLVADLLITYAFDLPETFQMVRAADVRQMGLSPGQLRAIALANLKKQIGNFGYTGNPPLLKLAVGNSLDACVLLVDEFWQSLAGKIPPEIVVGVPTRDVLLVTTTASTKGGIAMLRQAIAEAQTGDDTHWLTKHLLVRRKDKWEVFETAA